MTTTTTAALVEQALPLPERDLALLEALYEHRFLTGRQIRTLLFHQHPDPRTRTPVPTRTGRVAHRRLALLRQHDLLHRRVLRKPDGSREPEPYYCLSRTGAQLVAWRRGVPASEVRARAADALAGPLFVRHSLACAELACALVSAARANDGHACEPGWWQGERSSRASFRFRGRKLTVCPDGYTRYQVGRQQHHLLVEVDRATGTLARLAAKIDRYQDYARSGAWQERYPVFPKLLLTTTSERRLETLLARVEPPSEFVLLCANSAELAKHGPLAPIWKQPGAPAPRPLLEAQP
ncbi:MAG: replication-relaxation family protein [Gaiellaceae bacterium]